MAKPLYHALSSVKKHGGTIEDYIEIHNLMDSSKIAFADNRHRALTHNSWFINSIIEKVFGVYITNADGKKIPTKQIAEQHVLEDYGMRFIPTAQDFLENLASANWMEGLGYPPSKAHKESVIIKHGNKDDE
jgi:hypothetical protein